MVVIVSFSYDLSTSRVIEWLLHKKVPFIRINEDDVLNIISIDLEQKEFVFECKGKLISSREVTSYWFRKGWLRSKVLWKEHIKASLPHAHSQKVLAFLKEENRISIEFVDQILSKKKSIDSCQSVLRMSKLQNLEKAGEVGLLTPDTKLLTSRNRLAEFINVHGSVICKAIFEVTRLEDEQGEINMYTTKISKEELPSVPESFPLTLFQEYIEKKYELRIFILDGKCYSMAIFSQLDAQTSTDFRIYNLEKPNRSVPYNLPIHIEQKLIEFMNETGLVSGSVDMIVDKDGQYVFLEVNPVGQFGMVSYPCNYYLEKEIASYLSG